MKKIILLSLTALLTAGALAAVKLLSGEETEDAPERAGEPEQTPPFDPDQTVACPLKNKFVDYSRGQDDPIYLFELETPSGTKELAVTWAHYETYYIGDEVICAETEKGLQVI